MFKINQHSQVIIVNRFRELITALKLTHFDITGLTLEDSNKGKSFYMNFPISSPEFRASFPTKAALRISDAGSYTCFAITDDGGEETLVYIDSSLRKSIRKAKKEARNLNLL